MLFLVADDDPSVRRLWARILERMGHRCAGEDGRQSLAGCVARLGARAVISDAGLGRQDGIAACLELRREHPGLPIAIMTGDPDSAERARRAGFTHVLVKPFALEQARRLAEIFARHVDKMSTDPPD